MEVGGMEVRAMPAFIREWGVGCREWGVRKGVQGEEGRV